MCLNNNINYIPTCTYNKKNNNIIIYLAVKVFFHFHYRTSIIYSFKKRFSIQSDIMMVETGKIKCCIIIKISKL